MNVVPWQEVLMTTIREEHLGNGLQIIFTDESNRYFGDYHRVCVVATIVCSFPELSEASIEEPFRGQAIEALGERFSVIKRIERMGVATADVDEVRTALIDNFLKHAASYLSRPEYPRSLVTAELNKRRTHRFYG